MCSWSSLFLWLSIFVAYRTLLKFSWDDNFLGMFIIEENPRNLLTTVAVALTLVRRPVRGVPCVQAASRAAMLGFSRTSLPNLISCTTGDCISMYFRNHRVIHH